MKKATAATKKSAAKVKKNAASTRKPTKAAAAERLSFKDADARVDRAMSASYGGRYATVLFVDGDLSLDGDLLPALAKRFKPEPFDILAVTGDLHVSGRIALYEGTPGLWVGGRTTALTLEGGDCEIAIGDGAFDCFVYGYYNDGTLDTGDVETPWVINSNHDLRVPKRKGTMFIDNYGDDDDYDFGSENIGESFVPEVLGEDGNEIDIDAFFEHLKANKPVLVPGAMTGTEKALASVKQAKGKKVDVLDLSEKKLKAFPKDALAMPWLKELVLDGNEIKKVPKEIAKLTELEVLSLENCDLAALPEELGKLKKLRVLRIGSNMHYGKKTTPIALPKSFGELVSLEELDLSNLSTTPDGDAGFLPPLSPFVLPDAAKKLTRLRKIVADGTNLVLPKSMAGLASVEEISMTSASWAYLRRFPDFVLGFPNLKRLDLSGAFFPEIPAVITKLAKLEVLRLSNALGMLEGPLPDLSGLASLRELVVSGNTSHTGVPKPLHDKLRPLFKMRLPKLEVLGIDRWGKEGDRRGPLTAKDIAGIGRFKALRVIDLEFDGLTSLPDDFFTLPAIEELKFRYNVLPKEVCARLKKAFPKARIDLENQR